MKEDIKIGQLVDRVNALATMKKDFLVNTDELRVKSDHEHSYIYIGSKQYCLMDAAERQLSAVCGIPYGYVNRIGRAYPDLLDDNYNRLLGDIHKKKLVRTIGGDARAVLSDRYKRFENELVLETLLPLIDNFNGLSVVSASLTPEKMFIKLISDREKADVKIGDTVAFGEVITNSEIGMGSITINPFCLRLVCNNGMALPSYLGTSRRVHLGRKFHTIKEYEEMPTDTTSVYCRIKESIDSALDPLFYMRIVNKMKAATEIKIANSTEAIEKIANYYGLDENEQNMVNLHYRLGNDTSLYGLVNAVTRTAQDSHSYVRASELEKIGSSILYEATQPRFKALVG